MKGCIVKRHQSVTRQCFAASCAFSLAGCVAAFASEAVDAEADVPFGLMLQTYAYCGDSLSLASTLRRWPLVARPRRLWGEVCRRPVHVPVRQHPRCRLLLIQPRGIRDVIWHFCLERQDRFNPIVTGFIRSSHDFARIGDRLEPHSCVYSYCSEVSGAALGTPGVRKMKERFRSSAGALICWTLQLRLYLFSLIQQDMLPKMVSPK